MMKRLEPCEMYGIWNDCRKEFQFGVKTKKIESAEKALFKMIGTDAFKWRFEIRKMSKRLVGIHNKTQIKKQEDKINILIINTKGSLKSMRDELEQFKAEGLKNIASEEEYCGVLDDE